MHDLHPGTIKPRVIINHTAQKMDTRTICMYTRHSTWRYRRLVLYKLSYELSPREHGIKEEEGLGEVGRDRERLGGVGRGRKREGEGGRGWERCEGRTHNVSVRGVSLGVRESGGSGFN